MEEANDIMEENLISGPPASRSVIDNLKRLLTQRQHSRESDCEIIKEKGLHSTGSDVEQSEQSFYSHLSSSTSDSDESDPMWTGAFQMAQKNLTSPNGGRAGRRRRVLRAHSSSSSSSSPPPQVKRRRKPVSQPFKNIILSKIQGNNEPFDETTRVSDQNGLVDFSTPGDFNNGNKKRSRDGEARKKRRDYINSKIRRSDWTKPSVVIHPPVEEILPEKTTPEKKTEESSE